MLALTACEVTVTPDKTTFSASAPRNDAIAQDDWTAAAIVNLALGYSASMDVWPGYDPPGASLGGRP